MTRPDHGHRLTFVLMTRVLIVIAGMTVLLTAGFIDFSRFISNLTRTFSDVFRDIVYLRVNQPFIQDCSSFVC